LSKNRDSKTWISCETEICVRTRLICEKLTTMEDDCHLIAKAIFLLNNYNCFILKAVQKAKNWYATVGMICRSNDQTNFV
jgi:hypothetical protein